MKLNLFFLLFIFLIQVFLFGCNITNQSRTDTKKSNRKSKIDPVKAAEYFSVQINDTLFCDFSEIRNIDWKEYLFDISQKYGKESEKYNSVLPDTTGYFKLISDNGFLTDTNSTLSKTIYFRHEAYALFPVVGITLDQAVKFSAWRSNALFEVALRMALIQIPNQKVLKNQTLIEYFTQNDDSNEYRTLITALPHFYIPSMEEVQYLHAKIKSKELGIGPINSIQKALIHQKNIGHPLRPTLELNMKKRDNTLYNICGNVSELTSTNKLVAGGDYSTSEENMFPVASRYIETPSQFVGFRNFLVWKNIENQTISIKKSH